MGADSMQDKDAVIFLRKAWETIIFPGKAGYEIEWSPGTKQLPMDQSPSGHLVIPCDLWQKVASGKVHAESSTAFWIDRTHTPPVPVPGNGEPEVESVQKV